MSTSDARPKVRTSAELLNELVTTFKRHMAITDAQADALALWALHTWVYKKFQHTPRLVIFSPVRRCGKSTLLDLLRMLTNNPLKADSISEAALFRFINEHAADGLTVLIDEADTSLGSQANAVNVLNSGFEASGTTARAARGKNDFEPRTFSTFCPLGIAGIGKLPGTVMDRAVVIQLQRAGSGQRVEKVRLHRGAIQQLAAEIGEWAKSVDLSAHMDPEIPEGFGDRQADIVVALFAIADQAGGDWPDLARAALSELCFREEEEGDGITLLADIRDLFAEKESERLSSEDVCSVLADMEHRPWGDLLNGRPITKPHLARMLAPFGIGPKNIRTSAGVVKGYEAADFKDAWQRYLPPAEEEAPDVAA